MALSASRVAAFEFLIQFRSAGRNQIRNAVRQLKSVSIASNQVALSSKQNIALGKAYEASLVRQGISALETARRMSVYSASLLAARKAAAAATISNNQAGITRAFNSPLAALFGRFNNGGRAGAAVGINNIRKSLNSLRGPLTLASSGFNIFFGVIRGSLGLFTTFVKINTIAVAGLGILGAALAKVADTFTLLSNRIRVASSGTQSVSSTMNELLQISVRARAPVNDIAELYGRIAINAKQFGISQEEILRVVEITGKTFRIGGSNAREASQAALQFAQALGSNRLSGDELRAVREQATELSQTLARGLGVGVGKLKELGESGALTTKVVIDALLSQERIVNARFGRVEATFADGITNIRSAIGFFTGSVGSALKLGPSFFRFFDRLSQKFAKLANSSGFIASAIKSIPLLLKSLNLNALGGVFRILDGISDFLLTIPEKIRNFASEVNTFAGLVSAGTDTQSAIELAFGDTFENVRKRFEPFNNILEAFVTQLRLTVDAFVILSNAVIGFSRIIDNIGDGFAGFFGRGRFGGAGFNGLTKSIIGNSIESRGRSGTLGNIGSFSSQSGRSN